jgi:camelysin-like metallo-endopeptidase
MVRSERSLNALAITALGLLALAAMTGGTSANFTATTVSPANLLATATLALTNDKPNDGDLVNIANLVPGDTATRTVVISNAGTASFTYSASVTNQSTNALWTDTIKGLQVEAKRGATSLYSGALKNLTIPASTTIAPSTSDTLTFVFSLPNAADNSMQGLSITFSVVYTATQISGAAR